MGQEERCQTQTEPSESPAPDPPAIEPPPDGGYGWVCTVAAATINMHSWGFSSAYSVFLAHYLADETFPGATPLMYAFVGGLSLASLFLISPVATVCVGKFGIRPTMFAGMVVETCSMITASLATEIWHLFLTQGVLFGCGLGLLFIPAAAVVPQWFSKKRSLASGISLAGAALGGTVYSLAAGAIIRNISLQWALRTLGILACVVNTSCILLIRDRGRVIGSSNAAFNPAHFKMGGYWLLVGFSGFTMLGYFILIFTLADFARSLGLTSSQGAVTSAVFNLGQAIGRPLVGYFSDTSGRINMAASMSFVAGLLPLVMWVNTGGCGVLVAFALLEGLVAGTFWATIAPLMIEVVGIKEVASGLTPMWFSLALPCTFSEAIALMIVKHSGSYRGAQLFTGFMYIVAASCLFLLRGWKIGQLAESKDTASEDRSSDAKDGTVEKSSRPAASVGSFVKLLGRCFKPAKV
ncbi:hypothetical protein K4F52_004388 [Lecanicillium sp. MT-2017a]|nr:hypothetical protein K4F52_004388 [Lecanicillium sp. MT-2017a]